MARTVDGLDFTEAGGEFVWVEEAGVGRVDVVAEVEAVESADAIVLLVCGIDVDE